MPKYNECTNWKCGNKKCNKINKGMGSKTCVSRGSRKEKWGRQDVLPAIGGVVDVTVMILLNKWFASNVGCQDAEELF